MRRMALHLIKLCVGCDSVQDLEDWIKQQLAKKKKSGEKAEHFHTHPHGAEARRRTDRRRLALLGHPRRDPVPRAHPRDRARSPTRTASAAAASCSTARCKLVQPRPFGAFQGWRYLAAKDAPPDLDRAAPGARHMPETMRRELRELGLL